MGIYLWVIYLLAAVAGQLWIGAHDSGLPDIPHPVARCDPSNLSVNLAQTGDSAGGLEAPSVLLVLRNHGEHACRVPARPTLVFRDTLGVPIELTQQYPRAMRPGPVLLPIAIPAGQRVTSALQWASDATPGHGVCVTPASVTVQIEDDSFNLKFSGNICKEDTSSSPGYTLSPFRRGFTLDR